MKSLGCFVLMCMMISAVPQIFAQYALPSSVFGCGGTSLACASFRITGTIGQTHVGIIKGPAEEQQVGFWFQPRLLTFTHSVGLRPSAPRLLSVFPNPARDALVVEYAFGSSESLTISLHDMLGRCVLNRDLEHSKLTSTLVRLDTRAMSCGVYVLSLATGSVAEKKLVMLE